MEEDAAHRFEDNPLTSTRAVASQIGVFHKSVLRVLRDEKMNPFHVQRVQLSVTDYSQRIDFVCWLLDAREKDSNFLKLIYYTYNAHAWARTNTRKRFPVDRATEAQCEHMGGILGDYLIGPYLLPGHLNSP